MIDPERATKAYIATWELEGTDVTCDLCSRTAKFAVYHSGIDYYLCISHTAAKLEAKAKDLRMSRPVGAS